MKELKEYLNEDLLDAIKLRKQITELQGRVEQEYEAELENNPNKYRSGKQLLNAVYSKAQELYDEIVTLKDQAISFNDWWKQYEKANSHFLDMTIFNIK